MPLCCVRTLEDIESSREDRKKFVRASSELVRCSYASRAIDSALPAKASELPSEGRLSRGARKQRPGGCESRPEREKKSRQVASSAQELASHRARRAFDRGRRAREFSQQARSPRTRARSSRLEAASFGGGTQNRRASPGPEREFDSLDARR